MEIKAVVSSSVTEDIQKVEGPQSEFLTGWVGWEGWGEGDQKEPPVGNKITQYPRTHPEPSAVRMAWRESTQASLAGSGYDPEHAADSTCLLRASECSGQVSFRALGG